MRHLNAAQTAQKLPYAELVPAIARAAAELSTGKLNAPERLALPIGPSAALLCMPATSSDIGITKVVTVHQENRARGLPAIQGEVIVFDINTGERLLLLDGPTVTARRTAAVTLLGIEKLLPRRPQSALLIGTGVQAAAHVEALIDYFDVQSFSIAATSLPSATKFCNELCSRHPDIRAVPMTASMLDPAGVGTDVVIAATTSKVPVVPPELPDTALAIGVGAFRPEMAELPPQLLTRRHIVVDYLKGAKHEAGDLLQANIDWSSVTEISSLPSTPLSQPCVFKIVGHASWDLAAARVALR